jgi:hypothetical protein
MVPAATRWVASPFDPFVSEREHAVARSIAIVKNVR